MTQNLSWLFKNADIPIRYNLRKRQDLVTPLLQNNEVQYWLSRLTERAENKAIGDIHGSHDYRMENILGKCAILGLSKGVPEFNECMNFILDFLSEQVQKTPADALSFGNIYGYRDCEKVLDCFLPMLGYADNDAVKYIVKKRIDILYHFVKQNRYTSRKRRFAALQELYFLPSRNETELMAKCVCRCALSKWVATTT